MRLLGSDVDGEENSAASVALKVMLLTGVSDVKPDL